MHRVTAKWGRAVGGEAWGEWGWSVGRAAGGRGETGG